MKTLFRAVAGLFFTAAIATAQTAAPDMAAGPAPKGKPWEPGWGFWPKVPQAWQQTHEGMLKKRDKGGIEVLFLGDSITAGWSGPGKEVWARDYEPLKASNFGIGGDTTRQILWRIENGELDGLQPKVVVLMIGVNNIFQNNGTDDEIAKGVSEVITKILEKTPDSKILLQSILPLKAEVFDKRVQSVNPLIRELGGPKVTWFDLTSSFRGTDGKIIEELYVPDGTHLAPEGYEAWAKALTPKLAELLK